MRTSWVIDGMPAPPESTEIRGRSLPQPGWDTGTIRARRPSISQGMKPRAPEPVGLGDAGEVSGNGTRNPGTAQRFEESWFR